MIEAELNRIEGWLSGILADFSPTARARVTRQIATRTLRPGQAKRIAAQRNPDGSAYEARKAPRAPRVSNKAKKFLYPGGGSGIARIVLLKSWSKRGQLITGYDAEASGIRSFYTSKIIQNLPVTPAEESKGARGAKPRARASVKDWLMFRKLGRSGLLKAGSTPDEAWVGFAGKSALIGRVHQEGGIDRVSKRGPNVRYAQSELLGLTREEEVQVVDLLMGAYG